MKSADGCYYGDPTCGGDLWECLTCGEYFCEGHFHESEKGSNVECVACERERLEREEEHE